VDERSLIDVAQDVIRRDKRMLDMMPPERVKRAGTVRRTVDTSPADGRKPDWLKVKLQTGENFKDVTKLMGDLELNTVCQQASCPNIYECWETREATFLIGGDTCTRRCGFCDIMTGKPDHYDQEEPTRVAEAVEHLGLRYIVVTMVARDDLDDDGGWLIAETTRLIRERTPEVGVEVLPSDLGGADGEGLRLACEAGPDVFAHNIETVERLYSVIRPSFTYQGSLDVLARAKQLLPKASATKSNIIVGMGETNEEVVELLRDLRAHGVQIVTIGQYLQPSDQHIHLERWVTPEEFDEFKRAGMAMGFDHIESGPLVRSSYHAGQQAIDAGAWTAPPE
jgi:lipoic acid synthetase